jgi:hypothetical protein
MPRITDDPIQPHSVGLRKQDTDFIMRAGTGENLGAKLRSILTQCAEIIDHIVGCPSAVLVYNQTADGQKIWSKDLPFSFDKKRGWAALPDAAHASGYICQIVENKDEGWVEVWVALGRMLNDCEACRKRVIEAMTK